MFYSVFASRRQPNLYIIGGNKGGEGRAGKKRQAEEGVKHKSRTSEGKRLSAPEGGFDRGYG